VPELRRDPVTGEIVVVAAGRSERPFRTDEAAGAQAEGDCPFCAGHEHLTPPEVARAGPGEPDTPGWEVRVVPNKYPIVTGDSGAHEVVVLSPAHDRSLADLDAAHGHLVWSVLRDRCATHAARGLAYTAPFVNHGRAAGASIDHPHAQVVALDFVPPRVAAEGGRRPDWMEANAIADGEVRVWCPPAGGWPYEMAIVHPDATGPFGVATDQQIGALADALGDALRRLRSVVGDVPYNVVVHTSDGGWHVQVVPRLVVRAGFEIATGVVVNVVAPEDAAARLRSAP
jgi:UDPglucose--hexose-1-phosphate uridylyltransferase